MTFQVDIDREILAQPRSAKMEIAHIQVPAQPTPRRVSVAYPVKVGQNSAEPRFLEPHFFQESAARPYRESVLDIANSIYDNMTPRGAVINILHFYYDDENGHQWHAIGGLWDAQWDIDSIQLKG